MNHHINLWIPGSWAQWKGRNRNMAIVKILTPIYSCENPTLIITIVTVKHQEIEWYGVVSELYQWSWYKNSCSGQEVCQNPYFTPCFSCLIKDSSYNPTSSSIKQDFIVCLCTLTQHVDDGKPWTYINWDQKVFNCPVSHYNFPPKIKKGNADYQQEGMDELHCKSWDTSEPESWNYTYHTECSRF